MHVRAKLFKTSNIGKAILYLELQWLEHLLNHENMIETGIA